MESFRTLWVISPATLLDWALSGDEEIEDLIQDTPRKVKGRRKLLNLECSITYDANRVSSSRGKARLTLVSV